MTLVERMYPSDRVTLREVGMRDGLQMVTVFPSTAAKRDWLRIDHAAGVHNFELGSFLPSASFPQFADLPTLLADAAALEGVWSGALALNRRGGERALASTVDEIVCVVSASEAHNMANALRTREQTLAEIADLLELRQSGREVVITVAIAMAFGCSISGKDSVTPSDVLRIAARCVELGADVVTIADTVGYAAPTDVTRLVREYRREFGSLPLICHFHDTRGLGLANAAAALEEGVTILDGALAGLGGCPFAPNATGNVVLEDLAYLTQAMGFKSSVDPQRLLEARALIASEMPREPLHGRFAEAGRPLLRPGGH